MQSSNPVFNRSEGFNGRGSQNAYGSAAAGGGMNYPTYGAPTDTWSGGPAGQVDQGRMTIDTVVQKTAITLGVVVVFATLTWLFTGDVRATGSEGDTARSLTYMLAMVGALGGFALAMVNSFKRVVSPGLVLLYAVLEGVFVGAFSKVIAAQFGGD